LSLCDALLNLCHSSRKWSVIVDRGGERISPSPTDVPEEEQPKKHEKTRQILQCLWTNPPSYCRFLTSLRWGLPDCDLLHQRIWQGLTFWNTLRKTRALQRKEEWQNARSTIKLLTVTPERPCSSSSHRRFLASTLFPSDGRS
jgi:hypothetical protein